jgi:hypothetical protein
LWLRSKALADVDVAREVNVNTLTYYLNLQCVPPAVPQHTRAWWPALSTLTGGGGACEEEAWKSRVKTRLCEERAV